MTLSTISRARAAMAAGSTTSEQLLAAARQQAQAAADLNPLAHVDWDAAVRRARALDEQAAGGQPMGPLHGIPVTIKDLFNVADMPTRAGTRAPLPDLGRPEATLVSRLKAAGALVFAKTNMHEIALGATGENAWTGDVKNPRDPARQAGGSSSGAAVAVASGIGLAGIGSDTGGSVRIPAAFCGVVGFKPSYGAIPLEGGLYLSWTCDHAGPLARTVEDCALLYEVMSGRRSDHGAVPRGPRIAVPRAWLAPRLPDPVRESFERSLRAMRDAGADIVDVDTDALVQAWQCYTSIVRAEAAYVHRAAIAAGGQGFSESVLAPMLDGGKLLAGQYLEAMNQREQVRAKLAAIVRDHDAIALPTTAVLPPLRGQLEVEVAGGKKLSTREAVLGQTLAFSMVGLPAISLPTPDVNGLPGSLQLVGAFDADARLLALAKWAQDRVSPAI